MQLKSLVYSLLGSGIFLMPKCKLGPLTAEASVSAIVVIVPITENIVLADN